MNRIAHSLALLLTLSLTALLAACGGGGGGGGTGGGGGGGGGGEKPSFAFTISSDADYSVTTYAIGKTSGRLKVVSQEHLTSAPVAIDASLTGDAVYAIDSTAPQITQLRIDTTGTFTSTNSLATSATASDLAVSPDGKNIYVVNDATNKEVDIYRWDGTTFSDLSTPKTIASGNPAVNDQTEVLINPTGQSLYVVSKSDNMVIRFNRDTNTGNLTSESFELTAGTLPQTMALSPNGHLYVANTGGGAANIAMASLNSFGDFSSTFAAQASSPNIVFSKMVIEQTGTYLYALDSINKDIYIFEILADGTLDAPTVHNTGATTTTSLTTDPSGEFLYVTVDGAILTSKVLQYAISSTDGTLSAVSPSFAAAYDNPVEIIAAQGQTIPLQSSFAFVTNGGSDTLTRFSIGNDGSLSSLGTQNVSVGSSPDRMVLSPNGKFAYVTNIGNDTIDIFSVGSNGSLAFVASEVVAGYPEAIAFRPQGDFAYVVYDGASLVTIQKYTVETDGTLTIVPAHSDTFASSNTAEFSFLAIHPLGLRAYLTNDNLLYEVILAQTTGAPVPSPGTDLTPAAASPMAQAITIDQTGSYVYTAVLSSGINGYIIKSPTSNISTLTGYNILNTELLADIATSPDGNYLFAADDNSTTDKVHTIDIDSATGNITATPSSSANSGDTPFAIALSPSGDNLFSAHDDGVNPGVLSFPLDLATGAIGTAKPDVSVSEAIDIATTGPWQ